nr:hypothetical protein [Methylocystis sp. H62]
MEPLLVLRANVLVLRYQLCRQHDEIAKIVGVLLKQRVLVDFVEFSDFDRLLGRVDLIRPRLSKRSGCFGEIFLGVISSSLQREIACRT